MRPASFVLLLLVPVAACSEPDIRSEPVQVSWMEWPAEVSAATSFTVRLVGYGVLCVEVVKFVTAPTVDQSAVTFEPYFLLTGQPQPCRELMPSSPIIGPIFDTLVAVPGLEAQIPRTFEIRAGTDVSARAALEAFPIRTFGEITVQSAQIENGRINAGGLANGSRDTAGCVHLWPYGIYPGYVIENPPADTARSWSGFVRGYLYQPAAPVCGAATVFHLIT